MTAELQVTVGFLDRVHAVQIRLEKVGSGGRRCFKVTAVIPISVLKVPYVHQEGVFLSTVGGPTRP